MDGELPVLELGRYKLFETADGGWLLRRAVGICERCQGCGCGDQAEPVVVPGMIVAMAKAAQGNGNGGLTGAMMRRLGGRGNGDQSGGGGAEAAEGGNGSRRARRRAGAVGLPAEAAGGPADPAMPGPAGGVR